MRDFHREPKFFVQELKLVPSGHLHSCRLSNVCHQVKVYTFSDFLFGSLDSFVIVFVKRRSGTNLYSNIINDTENVAVVL